MNKRNIKQHNNDDRKLYSQQSNTPNRKVHEDKNQVHRKANKCKNPKRNNNKQNQTRNKKITQRMNVIILDNRADEYKHHLSWKIK